MDLEYYGDLPVAPYEARIYQDGNLIDVGIPEVPGDSGICWSLPELPDGDYTWDIYESVDTGEVLFAIGDCFCVVSGKLYEPSKRKPTFETC